MQADGQLKDKDLDDRRRGMQFSGENQASGDLGQAHGGQMTHSLR
jgi:hypothetical protein